MLSTIPVDVAEAAVFCRLRRTPPVIDEVVRVRAVPVESVPHSHTCAFAPLSMVLPPVAPVMPESGTELAAPFTVIQLEPSQNSNALLGEIMPPVHCTMPAL